MMLRGDPPSNKYNNWQNDFLRWLNGGSDHVQATRTHLTKGSERRNTSPSSLLSPSDVDPRAQLQSRASCDRRIRPIVASQRRTVVCSCDGIRSLAVFHHLSSLPSWFSPRSQVNIRRWPETPLGFIGRSFSFHRAAPPDVGPTTGGTRRARRRFAEGVCTTYRNMSMRVYS